MPRTPALAGGAGLFVPTYALWERDVAAAVVRPPRRARRRGHRARRRRRLDAAAVRRVPRRAVRPQPVRAGRAGCTGTRSTSTTPRCRPPPTPTFGDADRLARRSPAAAAASCSTRPRDLDPYIQAGIDRFVAGRPDVADFARFRAERARPGRRRPPGRARRAQPPARPVPRRPPARRRRGPGPRRARPRPADRQPPRRLRDVGPRRRCSPPAMTVGAPPDEFFADGQNWGFPPQLPGAGRRSGHALWRRLVARAGEHASMLRIDHVMGVQRLWWIPDGRRRHATACTCAIPREELLAVIAAEAARTSTTIVGENLGTVPEEVTEALERWDVVGHVRGAVQPVPPRRPAADPGPTRSPASAPTTCRRSPPPSTATPPAACYDYRRLRRRRRRAPGRRRRGRRARRRPRAARRAATPTSSSPTSTTSSARPRRTTCPGRCCRRRGGAACARPTSDMLADADVRRRLKLLSTQTRRGCHVTSSPNPVGELDLHLFNEGTHRHLHHCLGAHPDADRHVVRRVGAERRVRRRARRLRRLDRASRLEPIGRSGIWSAHVAGRARRASPTATPSPATTASGWRSPTPSARRRTSRRRRRR